VVIVLGDEQNYQDKNNQNWLQIAVEVNELRGESMDIKKRIEMIKKDGLTTKGKKELICHLEGGRLTYRQAIHAHCYDCMCYFIDGRADCEMPRCPLHPFMVFNRNRTKPKTRILTEEHIEKLLKGRKMKAVSK